MPILHETSSLTVLFLNFKKENLKIPSLPYVAYELANLQSLYAARRLLRLIFVCAVNRCLNVLFLSIVR